MTKFNFAGLVLFAYLLDIALFSWLTFGNVDYYLLINFGGKLMAFAAALLVRKLLISNDSPTPIRGRIISALIVMNLFLATCILYVTADLIKMPVFQAKLAADMVVILMSFVVGRYLVKSLQQIS
ncbi:hypothetical protein [Kordiimonas sp. SCSIO 12610]|uniref:hypothetical protein n=1 Tax=Kordiimonas sp. SCSIO 12610 TaxID=2829597 RepID=UPI00210E366A|nr:hypothetical protein [Kordiimonas sp. SCSIO 12610]UTW56340.1 hypothetical protein KFF44_05400 [Kordiimonas sp. SCSIO 12610]